MFCINLSEEVLQGIKLLSAEAINAAFIRKSLMSFSWLNSRMGLSRKKKKKEFILHNVIFQNDS